MHFYAYEKITNLFVLYTNRRKTLMYVLEDFVQSKLPFIYVVTVGFIISNTLKQEIQK